MKKLNVNKSCSPDAVHPRILKELADLIAVPIKSLSNKTLEKNEIPLEKRTPTQYSRKVLGTEQKTTDQ